MNRLNSRQWRLYNLLKERGDEWTHQIDIAHALPEFYYYKKEEENFHDSNARHLLTKDIRAINNSDEIQKVIVSGGKGIKIANQAEWLEAIRSEYKLVFSKLKRVRRKEKKGQMNGQMRMVFNTERDIIEAFLSECS